MNRNAMLILMIMKCKYYAINVVTIIVWLIDYVCVWKNKKWKKSFNKNRIIYIKVINYYNLLTFLLNYHLVNNN